MRGELNTNMKDKTLNNKSKQQSFLHGSLILVVATALVKIIGAIYRIPLANILDTAGMGFYSTAYDLYVPMYSIAMAGLPVAISRIVAEHTASGKYKDAKKTLKMAQLAFLVTGSTGFILMLVLAFVLTGPLGVFNIGSLPGILAIAPCLVFCCIMSAYRGYYEGLRNMTPTAISSVIEALGKLVFGFSLAYVILAKTGSYPYAAAGALFGITIGTAVSSLYLVIKYKLTDKYDITPEMLSASDEAKSGKETLKGIILVAVPIVLGSLVNNVTSLIDVAMVQSQLANAISKAPQYFEATYKNLIDAEIAKNPDFNWLTDLPNSLYGCHRGYAFSIYNLVPVLTSVLGVSAIPVLAAAWTKRDLNEVKSNVQTMLRTTALIALPAGIGIATMANGILSLLYSNPEAISIASPNLSILGVCAVFAGLNAPVINMLQAIGKQTVPLKNIAVGAILKIVVNFILVGTPAINIVGVPIGTAVCYAYICIANIICFIKYSGIKPNYVSVFLKPFAAATACGITAFLASKMLPMIVGKQSIVTVASIALAGIVYLLMLCVLKAIEREDVISLPKGKKIVKVLEKLGIIR